MSSKLMNIEQCTDWNRERLDIFHGCSLTFSIPGEIKFGHSQGLTISNFMHIYNLKCTSIDNLELTMSNSCGLIISVETQFAPFCICHLVVTPPVLSKCQFTMAVFSLTCDIDQEKKKVEEWETSNISVAIWSDPFQAASIRKITLLQTLQSS